MNIMKALFLNIASDFLLYYPALPLNYIKKEEACCYFMFINYVVVCINYVVTEAFVLPSSKKKKKG